jgi:hypothetical protein
MTSLSLRPLRVPFFALSTTLSPVTVVSIALGWSVRRREARGPLTAGCIKVRAAADRTGTCSTRVRERKHWAGCFASRGCTITMQLQGSAFYRVAGLRANVMVQKVVYHINRKQLKDALVQISANQYCYYCYYNKGK